MSALPFVSPAAAEPFALSAVRPRGSRRKGFGALRPGRSIRVTVGRNREGAAVAVVNDRVKAPVAAVAGATLGGKYTLLREAGMGGMGVVWVARNETTGGEVALKLLLPSEQWSAPLLARLRQEARATASLSHRGIVQVYDLVETPDGQLVLVLELLHGHTLAERIDNEEQIAPADAVRIALDLLSALEHVHGSGIVHRDIKPPNVFLATDPDGHVTTKLLDFGVSKMRFDGRAVTVRGELVGTPSYMSPEQAMGLPVDVRSDVFAMGILLYEMIGGANPFAGPDKTPFSVVLQADRVPPLSGVSPALWAVIARALSREPSRRFASAAAMASALREAMHERLHSLPRRRSRFWGGLAAASVVVFAFTVAIAPPAAFSAAHASPRLKMHRTALARDDNASVRGAADVTVSTPSPRVDRTPQNGSFARDPGF
jgi:serine/threonine protein kinase